MSEEEKSHGKKNAEAALEGIMVMVKRMNHAADCDGDPDECDLTDEEILEGINIRHPDGSGPDEEEREEYHDEERAREAIQEDALEVSVRTSGWRRPGDSSEADEYRVLITWGGPACQVKGDLDEHMEPENAEIQYQDWFTEWQTLPTTAEQDEALLTYARQFYFGE